MEKNWLILFQNEQSKNISGFCLLSDLSTSPDSFNQFEITEGIHVILGIVGDYQYSVYQMPTDTDTNYLSNGFLVETGKMRLIKENETEIKQYTSENDVKIFN